MLLVYFLSSTLVMMSPQSEVSSSSSSTETRAPSLPQHHAAAAAHRRARRLHRRHSSVHQESNVVPQINSVSFLSGLAAGVCQAGLFNPFDRALYLSVKNEVPFLTASNFQSPYQGFFQSVGHRALSGALRAPRGGGRSVAPGR